MLAVIDAVLGAVPKWVWVAIVAALSATSCKLKWDNGQLSIEIEKGKTYVAQLEGSIAHANETATKAALADVERIRQAESAARDRAAVLAADNKRAASELERLRVALAEATGHRLTAKANSLAPGLDYPDPTPDLLIECSRRYIELAGKADGHVNDIKTMTEAWPK